MKRPHADSHASKDIASTYNILATWFLIKKSIQLPSEFAIDVNEWFQRQNYA